MVEHIPTLFTSSAARFHIPVCPNTRARPEDQGWKESEALEGRGLEEYPHGEAVWKRQGFRRVLPTKQEGELENAQDEAEERFRQQGAESPRSPRQAGHLDGTEWEGGDGVKGGSRVVSTVLYKPLTIGGFDYGEEQRKSLVGGQPLPVETEGGVPQGKG